MFIRLILPDGTTITVPFDQMTTVKVLVEKVAPAFKIDPDYVTCYLKGNILLPFVKIKNVADEALLLCFPYKSNSEPGIVKNGASTRVPARQKPSKTPSFCKRIPCVIGNAVIPMVIDTGSSVSLLYSNHVSQAALEQFVDLSSSCHPRLRTPTNDTTPANGVIHSVEVVVNGVRTTAQFIVLPSKCPWGILGIDWLKKHDARIDVRKGILTIGGEKVPFPRLTDSDLNKF